MFWNRLLGKAGADQLDQTVNRSLLIGTVSNNADGGAADDAQTQDTEQRLGVDTALLLLDPDGGLVFVGLLDEEGSRTGVQTNLISGLTVVFVVNPQRC